MSLQPVGNLYVVCAPSGTGKTTLVKALTESLAGVSVSISYTTRPKRSSEEYGINYYFIHESTFQTMIDENAFLEYAIVFDHFYGTSRQWVENALTSGSDVILEIDWQGHQQIHCLFPECISIFILPPSSFDLSKRLHKRNQDNLAVITQRLSDARETISHIHEFDYIIVNDVFNDALNDLKMIVQTGRLLQKRQLSHYSQLITELKTI